MERRKIKVYLIVGALFLTLLLILYIRADRIEANYKFNGIVKKITFGDKGTPKIIIGKKSYFLTYPTEDFNNKIRPGDSLIKKEIQKYIS